MTRSRRILSVGTVLIVTALLAVAGLFLKLKHDQDVISTASFPLALQTATAAAGEDADNSTGAPHPLRNATLSGAAKRRFTGHADGVLTAAYSHDGKRIVTAGHDHTARVWDTADGREVLRLDGHAGPVYHAAFSPDDRRIATCSIDGDAMVWDARTGSLLAFLDDQTIWGVRFVAFAKDGRLMTGSVDGTVRFWDVAEERETSRFDQQQDGLLCGSLTPDETLAVTGGDDGSIEIWDMIALKQLRKLALIPPPAAGKSTQAINAAHSRTKPSATEKARFDVESVVFAPDQNTVFTVIGFSRLDQWDAVTGAHLLSMPVQTSPSAVAIHPTRPLLAVAGGSGGGAVQLWRLPKNPGDDAILTQQLEFGYLGHWLTFSPDGNRLLGAQGGYVDRSMPANWHWADQTDVFEWELPKP